MREDPKPKNKERVTIPSRLREAMQEVRWTIEESERDMDVRVDYGDAIQADSLVGGRIGDDKRPYEFLYYAGEENRDHRWHLALSKLDIDDIAEGFQTELTLYRCQNKACGHTANRPDRLCGCDYDRDDFFDNYPIARAAEILERLKVPPFDEATTRSEVIAQLGDPTESGGGFKDSTLGYIHRWIKYQREDCQLRFEFGNKGKLTIVSVLEPDWEPGI